MDAKKRERRIIASLEGADKATIALVRPLVEEVAWMEQRLVETRTYIGSSKVVIRYDNGGGQVGIRKNPAYDAYHDLFRSYTAGLKALRDATGKAVAGADDAGSLAAARQGSPVFKAV